MFVPMGIFGHSSRLALATSDVIASVSAWSILGFTVLATDSDTDPTFARLTDGQIIVTFMRDSFPSPMLAYFSAAVARVAQRAHDKGVLVTRVSDTELRAVGPGGLPIVVHYADSATAIRPTREQNPVIGYHNALVVGVDDVEEARIWAERAGFLVEVQTGGSIPQIDMTDGISKVAFLGAPQAGIALSYSTDIDEELVQDITAEPGIRVTVSRDSAGQATLIHCVMPEGTRITIAHDD